jgi:hypothetical protein
MVPKDLDRRPISLVAGRLSAMYLVRATANSVAGIGVLTYRRTHRQQSGFFVSNDTAYLYGRAVWGLFGGTGSYVRHANPHGSAHHDWRHGGGENIRYIGDFPMTKRRILTLNPFKARALFHRACAMAALRSDSSLSVRLKRYNHHSEIARNLEKTGGAQ